MEARFGVTFRDTDQSFSIPSFSSSKETFGLKVQEYTEVMVKDYNRLDNKPSIETVTLQGDKTFEELGMSKLTNQELRDLLDLSF